MLLKDKPIQRKLMTVIMAACSAVLLFTCISYFIYDVITFRQETVSQLSTLGKIISTNSTAALAFDNSEDAHDILSAIKANPHIVSAALYDEDGNLFSRYPENLPATAFPAYPGTDGYHFRHSYLEGFQPVVEGNKRMGTLFLKSDMGAIYRRLLLYFIIALPVIAISFLVAYVISSNLQKRISSPILALAETAKAISSRQDYTVRAQKLEDDELGLLTDAFNHMLGRIQQQNQELSESSARVRSVLNSAMSAVIVMDANGMIMDWNMRAEKMFGLLRSEVLGKELVEIIIPPSYREPHRQGLLKFLATGEGPLIDQLTEISALRKDGSEFPVELSVSVLKTGDVVSFCGFITDITERKQAEKAILSFNQSLEQKVAERTEELQIANKELEAFSYSVSHDLRAPLRSIHGYMNIFSEDYYSKLDDEGKRLIDIILRNSKTMGQLIDDLLGFSQLGRRELIKGPVSMNEMVKSIWEDHKRPEGNRNIVLHLKKLPDAYADSGTIKQVWANLISNALKYSSHKEKTIIEIGSDDKEDESIYYIKDNGAGFDMKYYDKLFGVFQRLHSMGEFEGTGVGLAIVQRIISKHGGKVWAEAKPEEGASFYFTLPKNRD